MKPVSKVRVVVNNLTSTYPRLGSIDLLRGLVMVIMALDHVRWYFSSAHFDPTDLSRTDAALFFTRWITHFCAPVFFLLAGPSAFLSTTRGRTRSELAFYLLTRGLWLMVLELTIVAFAWTFNFHHEKLGLGVIWALGCSMVILAGLVYLPSSAIAAFGILMIVSHNLFDNVRVENVEALRILWAVFHSRESIQITPTLSIAPSYPLIPWVGVMAVGYALGPLLSHGCEARQRQVLVLGAALTLAFVVLRIENAYGDPRPWSEYQNELFTVLSFLNTTKYPPSLLYLLMTLGPAIAALPLLARVSGPLAHFFIFFGRVPLFYYILHLYLIHTLALGAGYLSGYEIQAFLSPFWLFPKDYGFSLPIVYSIWIAVVFLLYPVCLWYGNVKASGRYWVLSYL
jgi:Predicted membrane protein